MKIRPEEEIKMIKYVTEKNASSLVPTEGVSIKQDNTWITSKDLLYSTVEQQGSLDSTGNSAQCYVVAWIGQGEGAVWETMDKCICMAEFPLLFTALLICYLLLFSR